MLINILSLILAYLLGSIPTAVWVGKRFYGVDVREYGSGNAGATNTFRVLGKRAGIPVLLIDIFKGWLAVSIPALTSLLPGSNQYVSVQIVLGIAALLGHIFPIFASFRGGKGIATLLGVVISLHPQAALVSIVVFLAMFLSLRIVSLASMISAIAFPIAAILIFRSDIPTLNIFSILIACLVLVTHQKNIERLLAGEESKVKLFGKSNSDSKEETDGNNEFANSHGKP